MPKGFISSKMASEGLTQKQIDAFFASGDGGGSGAGGADSGKGAEKEKAPSAGGAAAGGAATGGAGQADMTSYVKMMKMRMPVGFIKSKMTKAGISVSDQDKFFEEHK